MMSDVNAVDDIVAKFTQELLNHANKKGISFDYAGNTGDKPSEIKRTMKINDKTVNKLLEPDPIYRRPVKQKRFI